MKLLLLPFLLIFELLLLILSWTLIWFMPKTIGHIIDFAQGLPDLKWYFK